MTKTMKPGDLARAKWRSSGLSDAHAKALKFAALSAKQIEGLGSQPAAALRIPYFDARGKETNFFRLRYLEPVQEVDRKGKLKLRRYWQPPGSLNEVYLPPLTRRPWAEVLRDPSQGLVITEGELKSACAAVHGFYAIGLGGVDLWRSSSREISFFPQLADVAWNNRPVTIVFDSDAATNENVTRAQSQLGKVLVERGAVPKIASLPSAAGGAKQGLDDFLVAKGSDAFRVVLEKAEALEGAAALWAMNDRYIYVDDPGLVMSRDKWVKMKPGNFVNHHAAHLRHTDFDGGKPKKVGTAKAWLEWPHRFQVDRLAYVPDQPQVVEGCFNTWKGLGVEPKAGSAKPWNDLLDYLFRDAQGKPMPEERKDFERWCAYPLQHPGVKLYTCFVLWGTEQGTGKTFAGYLLKDIYGENGIEIKDQHLSGSFNTWAEGKQFVLGDEVTGDGGQRSRADRLKGFITQQEMIINTKHVPEYRVDDCINYLFTSNHRDAFFLSDSDRRFRVHQVHARPAPTEFYERLDRWRHKEDGPAKLLRHLLDLDLGSFNPKAHAPMTDAKQEMIDDGRSDVARWVNELHEAPRQTLLENLGGLTEAHAACQLFTARELLRCYDRDGHGKVTETGLGKELKNVGIAKVYGNKPVRTAHGTKRLYAVADVERWMRAPPKELSAHRDRFFGVMTAEEKY